MQAQRPQLRIAIVAGIALLWMAAVTGRLAWLQLLHYSDFLSRAQHQQQRIVEVTPQRGAIYDRNMQPLAMSIPVDSAFAVPSEIADADMVVRLLSSILGKPRDELAARLESSKSFVWIARKLPPEKAQAIAALNLKGIYFQKENQRYYPKRDLAAHVLGYVDLDEKGIAGIEYELDKQIRGKPGKIMVLEDARSRWFDTTEASRDIPASVVLTLDEKIQYIAQRELASAIAQTHAFAGTIIVQDPNDGKILALANWPRFNPNAAGESSNDAHTDRAVSSLYEPGSTFKLITLAAAFEEHQTRPDEVLDCQNGSISVAGHVIHDHKRFGMLTVANILAQSSDVGAIKIALRVGAPKFYDYIRGFGFGAPTGVDLPGESTGIVRRLDNWGSFSIGSISMGQEVGVTPIQLISAVSAIANGGMLYRPRVVQEIRRDGQVVPMPENSAFSQPKRVIQPDTAATLRQLMEGVILNGTGTLAHLDGWTAAGKTGSAQKIDPATGRYSPNQLIASFTGFAPLNNPTVTILISLDSPVGRHEGGQVAAPVFKRVAEQVLAYLDVPRDVPVGPRLLQASLRQRTADSKSGAADASALEDAAPVDFSAQTIAPLTGAAAPAGSTAARAPLVTVATDEGGDIEVPDLHGRTMREATQICLHLGLEPALVGSGLAVDQSPAPAAHLRRGGRVVVQFGAGDARQRHAQQGTGKKQ